MLQKIINLGIYLVALSLPLYLVRFKIWWIPVTLLEIIIYGLFILWLVSKIQQNNFQLKKATFFYPIFLIFLGMTLATLFSDDLRASAGIWKGWFIVPLLYLVVLASCLKTKEQIRNILFALTLSGTGVALIALFYWLNNELTYDGRLGAFYPSPNYLAFYLSPLLILSFYLYSSFKNKISKILLLTANCLLFIVIYLTYSYGAWLGIAAALIFLLICFRQLKIRAGRSGFSFYLVGFILLLVILSFLWQIPGQKFQGFLDFSYPSLKSRLVIWQSAWEIIKDHPLIGIGPGMFQKYYLAYQVKFPPYLEWTVPQPHNLFLAFWLQTGLIGLVGFIWLLIWFFKKNFARKAPKILPIVLMATMIYILIHGLIDTPYWKNDLSVIFWLLIALSYTRDHFAY